MSNEQMQPVLDAWYRDRDEAPRDPNGGIARVMARVPEVCQRGRWWPLPSFDRPLSAFPAQELAPAPMPATNWRQPARGSTMFSAVKLMVASVIVALFGGFLLTGILTTQQGDEVAPAAATKSPSPMTSEDLLSGMVTEEVEPGVYRVINDGVRSLSPIEALRIDTLRIAAGHDGGIRLLDGDGFYRLGSEEYHEWPGPLPDGYGPNMHQVLEVAPDGTMWIIPAWSSERPDIRSGSALRSTDGEQWVVQPCPGESDCQGVSVAPDGTVWAHWREGPEDEDGEAWVGQLGSTGWQALDGDPPYEFSRMAFTDAGDLYGVLPGWTAVLLYRYVDGAWQVERHTDGLVDVGLDGTIWSDAGACPSNDDPPGPCGQDGLARFAGGEWEGWTSADLPEIAHGFGRDGEFRVAPDGSLWFSRWRSADGTDPRGDEDWGLPGAGGNLNEGRPLACDGLARFNGETLRSWLPAACISMDIAADGSVWVLADEQAGKDLYVITPEAMAVAE